MIRKQHKPQTYEIPSGVWVGHVRHPHAGLSAIVDSNEKVLHVDENVAALRIQCAVDGFQPPLELSALISQPGELGKLAADMYIAGIEAIYKVNRGVMLAEDVTVDFDYELTAEPEISKSTSAAPEISLVASEDFSLDKKNPSVRNVWVPVEEAPAKTPIPNRALTLRRHRRVQ